MKRVESVLKLNALVFDKIYFERNGMKNDEKLELSFSVSVGTNITNQNEKKVSLSVKGNKAEEYVFEVQATGYFTYEGDSDDAIIQQNAVAIVMPYVRSEISLLTAQPGVEPVVLPPFNIVEMMK
ncbi:MAG: protein-export chaperone SecB [Lachnospiraceae bacterium]|nr:protein-export chaperone SecB [Lachnospiraceae bacterium]